MAGTHGGTRRRALRIALVSMVVAGALLVPGVALAATPTAPVLTDVYVSSTGHVTVSWNPSTDADGHTLTYRVYRLPQPITAANRASATDLGTYSGTSVEIAAAAAEIEQAYVWYYAVRAEETAGSSVSAMSKTMAPDLHGYRLSSTAVTCTRCHSVHGATTDPFDHTDVRLCYKCHGSNESASDIGDRSTYNIKAEFKEYESQEATGSWHRSDKMVSEKTECDACHSAHRSPYYYDNNGNYVEASSFRKMLRVQTGPDTYVYYSANTDTAESTAFCLACHGADAQPIGYVGDANDYAEAAGDHTYPAGAAHGTAVIKSNDYGRANEGQYPQVQCLACHDKHASAADKLVAYRGQDTTTTTSSGTFAQAELCYACHSTTSTETKVTGSAKPFAWNGRGVKQEFSRTGSSHPVSAGSGRWVPTSGTVFSQTTAAEFNTGTLSQTSSSLVPDSVVLAQYTTTITPPTRPMLYAQRGGVTTFSSYDSGGTWSTTPADNSQWVTGSGASAFWLNGRFYTTRGTVGTTSYATQAVYNPVTNTWAAGQTLSEVIGVGGGSTVNTRPTDTCVYYTSGNGSGADSRIMWWNYTDNTTGEFNFQTATNTDRLLGIGSDIAYAPDADRLFVIYNNTTTAGDGRIYWRSAPGRTTTDVDFTQGVQVVDNMVARYNRMEYFKKNGVEYLFAIGESTAAVPTGVVISALAGTPAKRDVTAPFGNVDLGDGCNLVWDGGDYLYAFRGGSSTTFARTLIPADPVTGTWTWTTLTASFAQDAGTVAAIDPTYQPPDTTGQAYYASGTITTGDITPVADSVAWGSATWTATVPASTALSVRIDGWTGSSWTTLAVASDGPVDLSEHSVTTYPKLRLVGTFTTTDNQATPRLDDWTVTSSKLVWQTSGSLTCANCHNAHSVTKGGTAAWDFARVSDPANTKLPYAGGVGDFCLRCHGVTPPSSAIATTDTLVPYAVGFRTFDEITSPFFFGKDLWNKSYVGADWAGSRHNAVAAIGNDCGTCHDPHSSNFDSLTAYTNNSGTIVRANTDAAVSQEENLCYASNGCHNSGAAAANVQSPMAATYSHTAENVTPSGHSDEENGDGLGASNRHSECADCHDPHAARAGLHPNMTSTTTATKSSKPGEALRGASGVVPVYGTAFSGKTGEVWATMNASTGYDAERMTGDDADYEAYVCLKCHSSYTTQPASVTRNTRTYTPTDIALEFNPSNQSEHNVFGQRTVMETAFTVNGQPYTWTKPADTAFLRTGWNSNSPMTCTDCHANNTAGAAKGPHGSTVEYMIADGYTTWTNTSTFTTTTLICFKCHTNLATSNLVHKEHEGRGNSGGYCRYCHVKVPHGWQRPRLIGYTTDPAPYATIQNGINSIILKSYTPDNWQKAECGAACSSSRHPVQSNPWP